MVDHLNVSYLYKKRGVFYFTKRVPCDVKSYYTGSEFIFLEIMLAFFKENIKLTKVTGIGKL